MTYTPRDPARIERILELLRVEWLKNPDLRLGQLATNLAASAGWGQDDVYYVEDSLLEEELRDRHRAAEVAAKFTDGDLATMSESERADYYFTNRRRIAEIFDGETAEFSPAVWGVFYEEAGDDSYYIRYKNEADARAAVAVSPTDRGLRFWTGAGWKQVD